MKEFTGFAPKVNSEGFEVDDTLSALDLFELQGHVAEVIEKGTAKASKESNDYVAKFLIKNFL